MKYSLIVFLFFVSFLCAFSQPNGGFEDWEQEYGNDSPVGWQTPNFLCAFPFNPVSATKASGIDKHSGNYALKLKSVHLVTNPAPNLLDDTIGAAFTGSINLAPLYLKHGYPYNARPQILNVWYKYIPLGEDQGTAGALLTKWNGVKRDTIAIADSVLGYNPTFSLLQLQFNYFSEELPDSAVVLLASSRYDDRARVNSTLFVDDVEFSGWVAINDDERKNIISLYPNPAKDELHFKTNVQENVKVNIIDATGKRITTLVVNGGEATVDTRNYCSGIYFYEVMNEKNGVITREKFTVMQQ
jgi:hypothetical protein